MRIFRYIIFLAISVLSLNEAKAQVKADEADSLSVASDTVVAYPQYPRQEMKGAFLKFLQKRVSVLIADQFRYGVVLENIPDRTELSFLNFDKEQEGGLDIVSGWKLDTLKVRKDKSRDIQASVVLTAFDEGHYTLKPIEVLRTLAGGETSVLVFDSLSVDVKTVAIDTSKFQIHDIKGQIRYPLTFKEILPYFGGIVLLAAIISAIVYFVMRRRRKASEKIANEPPHIIALRKLDQFRGNKYWSTDKQKFFYSGVTDTLREYIEKRYDIGAMEMTTAEIFRDLKTKDMSPGLYEDLKVLFQNSDFVKYAKMTLSDEDNAGVLPLAVRFVTETYQEVIDKEAEVEKSASESSDPVSKVRKVEEDSDYMPKQ